MSQAAMFRRLRAPLNNPRWSWGSVRSDGAVFLRVWEDREIRHEGAWYLHVGRTDAVQDDDPEILGRNERLQHLALIHKGARSYMVICRASNENADSRVVKSVNGNEVFIGGRIFTIGEDVWLERVARIPVSVAVAQEGIQADR